jgi:hypothetical protein
MNIQFNIPKNVAKENPAFLLKGRNALSKKILTTKAIDLQGQGTYRVDDSLLEINNIRKNLHRQLMGDGKASPKTLEQLHSEIREKYVGKEYEKYVVALSLVQQDFDTVELPMLIREEAPHHAPCESPDAWRKGISQAEMDFWGRGFKGSNIDVHYLNPNFGNAVVQNRYDNGLILDFMVGIKDEFWNNGIESGLALFEKIHTDLLTKFQGSAEELNARIEALERGFMKAVNNFAEMSAAIIMIASPRYIPPNDGIALTRKQIATNERFEREAAKLTTHIQNMFRSALAFFRATGSFAGFLDSEAANQEGLMSLRDVGFVPLAILENGGKDSVIQENVAFITGLSFFGKDYLQMFYQIA